MHPDKMITTDCGPWFIHNINNIGRDTHTIRTPSMGTNAIHIYRKLEIPNYFRCIFSSILVWSRASYTIIYLCHVPVYVWNDCSIVGCVHGDARVEYSWVDKSQQIGQVLRFGILFSGGCFLHFLHFLHFVHFSALISWMLFRFNSDSAIVSKALHSPSMHSTRRITTTTKTITAKWKQNESNIPFVFDFWNCLFWLWLVIEINGISGCKTAKKKKILGLESHLVALA